MPTEANDSRRGEAGATALAGVRSPAGLLAAFAQRVAQLSGWRRWLAALAAGAVSILAMAPFHAWPVLLVTLPVLIWLIEGAARSTDAGGRIDGDRRRLLGAAAMGWSFGYGFHVAGLYWLREAFEVTGGGLALLWPLGVLGLPAFLALFHALAAAFAVAVSGAATGRVLGLALGLSATEWLRGNILTGFPWNVLGMALTGQESLMQSAGVAGIYGLTLVVVVVLGGPGVLVAAAGAGDRPQLLRWMAAAMFVVPLGAMYGYGVWRLSMPPPPMVEGVRLRLVQPSVPQREKWQAERQLEFFERHLKLTKDGPDGQGMAGITHVIWPEAAMPFLPLQRPQVLQAIGEALPDGVHLLAGILRLERVPPATPAGGVEGPLETRVFNSLAVFDDTGRATAVYDKTHLVPFGEYLPLPGLLESIGLQALTRQRGGFTAGQHPRPLLSVAGLAGVGPLICYEAMFPGSTRSSQGRPSVLLNITNDGWFGNSTGPRQHLHQARLRSVEEGLPLIRVANNGISAAFDAFGRELSRLDLDVAGVVDTGLPGSIAPPIYSRLGDLPFGLVWCGILLGILRTCRKQ